MAEYPYTSSYGRLKEFLDKIKQSGVPDKLTQKLLQSMGFKSNTHRRFIGILKYIGFIDASGKPTELWQQFRDRRTGAAVLGGALRESYGELFALYPDAHRKDNEALTDFFSTHTKVGRGALNYIVHTFKTLAGLANFESADVTRVVPTVSEELVPVTRVGKNISAGIQISINIQLAIPATDDPKTYDLFFSAMKKHLLES